MAPTEPYKVGPYWLVPDPVKRLFGSAEFQWRVFLGGLTIALAMPLIGLVEDEDMRRNWSMVFWYGFALVMLAQLSNGATSFYRGEGDNLNQVLQWFTFGKKTPEMVAIEKNQDLNQEFEGDENIGFWQLLASSFSTFIFAKTVQEAALYGGRFGWLGGLGFMMWYLPPFITAAIVAYRLRTTYGFGSLAEAINACYGPIATLIFGLALLYKMNNEIWTNALVVAGFFDDVPYSSVWWLAVILSTAVPLLYALMGGLRGSTVTHTITAPILFIGCFVILGWFATDGVKDDKCDGTENVGNNSITDVRLYGYKPPNGQWEYGAWELFFAGLIQGFISYPFSQPILTDRAFISRPNIMFIAFMFAGVFSGIYVIMFSGVGIFGMFLNREKVRHCNSIISDEFCTGAGRSANWAYTDKCGKTWDNFCTWDPVEQQCSAFGGDENAFGSPSVVAKALGGGAFTLINVIFMTAAWSTVDSVFNSTAKLVALDFGGFFKIGHDTRDSTGPIAPDDYNNVNHGHMRIGRWAMGIMALLGLLPVFALDSPEVLHRSTMTPTMMIGLGPPIWLMIFWKFGNEWDDGEAHKGWKQAPLAFIAPVGFGFIFGIIYNADWDNPMTSMGQGPFARLLGVNVVGHIVCIVACALGMIAHQYSSLTIPTVNNNFPELEGPSIENAFVVAFCGCASPRRAVDNMDSKSDIDDWNDGGNWNENHPTHVEHSSPAGIELSRDI